MTSQITSCIKYLIPTYTILLLLLHSKIVEKIALLVGFQCDLMTIRYSGFLGHTASINFLYEREHFAFFMLQKPGVNAVVLP